MRGLSHRLLLLLVATPVPGANFVAWPRLHSAGAAATSCVAHMETPAAAADECEATGLTRQWIENVVIRLGLCPFAAKPFMENKIRYVVTDARSDAALLEEFYLESALLLQTPEAEVATTFVIAPHYKEGIEGFYWLYEWLVDEQEGMHDNLGGGEEAASGESNGEDDASLQAFVGDRVQPAFFHPSWTFSGLPEDAPIHFEKRAPYPVINLLRRADLNRVVEEGLRKGVVVNKEIAEHNAAALEHEGFERLQAMFAQLRPAAELGSGHSAR